MLQSKISIALLFALCLVFAAADTGKIQAQVYVTRVSGNWHLSGDNSSLRVGQTLPAGKRVINPNSNQGESIELVGGSQVWQIYCGTRNAPRCRTGMVVPTTTLLGRLWDSVMSYWSGDKEKYTVHMVRNAWIADGIAKYENGETDLTALFKPLRDDTYFVKFRLLKKANGSSMTASESSEIKNAQIEWKQGDSSSAGKVKIKDLQPGLYEVIKTDRRGGVNQGSAWILVMPADKYKSSQNEFTKLKSTVKRWEAKQLSEETSNGLLRAGLEYLSQEIK